MRIPQLFIRMGKDRYAPVPEMLPNEVMYQWDEEKHRIRPVKSEFASDTENRPSTGFYSRPLNLTVDSLKH